MSFDWKKMLKAVVEDAQFVGEEAAKVGENILEFAAQVSPSAMPVVTDVLVDIAAGGVTPAQAVQQIQDATNFLKTAQGAIAAIKAQDVPEPQNASAGQSPAALATGAERVINQGA